MEQDGLRLRHFVEEVGLLLEQLGLPRMAGRVFGRLLVCQPEAQSSAELASWLLASKASISTTTRLLVQLGLIHPVPGPNPRQSYFAVKPETFDSLLAAEVHKTRLARELLDRGLELLADQPPAHGYRLRELRDLYAFFEAELPPLHERWRQRRGRP